MTVISNLELVDEGYNEEQGEPNDDDDDDDVEPAYFLPFQAFAE